MKIVIVLLALVAVVYGSGECNGCNTRRDTQTLARAVDSVESRNRQPKRFPCRFDCMQLVSKSNNQPLFASCQSSILAYSGDYFGDTKNPGFDIDFQCFTPSTYQNYFTSRAKLAFVIGQCQNAQHGCRKAGGRSYDVSKDRNYAGLPNINTLAVRTTAKYYQWYSLFSNIDVVNNVLRCPASFDESRSRGRSCDCSNVIYPELFVAASPKMPSAISDTYVSATDIPSPVSPSATYVNGFLGNYSNINPVPYIEGEPATLVSLARQVTPVIRTAVFLQCIDDDVDITSQCDNGRD
jgi:hypothetical protein